MISNPATRIVAAAIGISGLAITPLLDKGEPADSPLFDPIPFPSPHFQIHRGNGELILSGHTTSTKHEQDLNQVAKSSYFENNVSSDFQPLGIVPSYWEDTTLQVLYLLAETASADAEISRAEIRIQGVTVDQLGWQSRLAALKKTLPPDVSISADTLVINPSVNVAEVCQRASSAFVLGPINFEESSADFRTSAYPRLARLVTFLQACRNSHVSITGHTDATGNEAWNTQLSLRRASAVGDYLITHEVERARLVISGAGSAVPIADDATRFGRSLNRRIELTFLADD